jgi:hypothetical protein
MRWSRRRSYHRSSGIRNRRRRELGIRWQPTTQRAREDLMRLVRAELIAPRQSSVGLHSGKIIVQIRSMQAALDDKTKDCAVARDGVGRRDGGGELVAGGRGVDV